MSSRSPYPYYNKQGEAIYIDHNDPVDAARLVELWDHDYRRICQDYVGKIHVSTVFLPLDHGSFGGNGDGPVIFETMVFGYDGRSPWRRWWDDLRKKEPDEAEYQWRYRTERAARAGHEVVLSAVLRRKLTQQTLPYICEEESLIPG